MLRPVRWVDPADDRVRTAARYGVAQLPTALADFCLRRNLGDHPTSERAKGIEAAHGTQLHGPAPNDAGVLDLDQLLGAELEQQSAEAVA
jgi:hypothetical protein